MRVKQRRNREKKKPQNSETTAVEEEEEGENLSFEDAQKELKVIIVFIV